MKIKAAQYVIDLLRGKKRKQINSLKKKIIYFWKNSRNFSLEKGYQKSVLLVEPNPFHGEILPGFVKYFQDLGYKTDCLLRHENIEDFPFVRFDGGEMPVIYRGTASHMRKLLTKSKLKNYDFVVITSTAFWENDFFHGAYKDYLGAMPEGKYGTLLIEHNVVPCLKEYGEEIYQNQGRLFTLSGFYQTPMLNPHYFGEVEISPLNEDKIRFVVVGGINKDSKNHNLLFDETRKLLKQGITNFEIAVCGGGKLDIPEELRSFILFKGRVSFADMYKEMEKADYFLPLLDASVEGQRRYLNGTTSGSRQLILGFLKPCLINNEFAQVYGFNNENSLVYENNDLAKAMAEAIKINADKYKLKQVALKKEAESIYQISLGNLRAAINRVIYEAE